MSRLQRNIIYNLTGQLALLVLSFASAKFIFRGLGKDILGIIYFALMLNTVVVAILELGVTTTTIKEISANEVTDRPYVIRLMRSGACFYWTGYAVVAIGFAIGAPWMVRRWIQLETLSPDTAIRILRVLGISALLSLPQTFYVSVFRGVQRMGVPNVVDVLATIAQQVGIIVIIALTQDVTWVVWWIAAIYVARIATLILLTSRLFGWAAMVPAIDREIVRRNRRFAMHMMAISLLAMVHTQSDKLLISAVLPVSGIGMYALLYGAFARGGVLTSAVAQGAFPALSQLHKLGKTEELARHYENLQSLLCYGLVPVYAFVAFATRPVFSAVLDPDLASALVLPGCMLAVGFYLNGTLTVPYYFSIAVNKPEIGARLNFLALVTTLPVTLLLTWQLGFAGAAASWIWYQLFAYVYFVPRVCNECLGLRPRVWFAHVARILALVAISYGPSVLYVACTSEPTIVVLAVTYTMSTLVFIGLAWFAIGANVRSSLMTTLHRARR